MWRRKEKKIYVLSGNDEDHGKEGVGGGGGGGEGSERGGGRGRGKRNGYVDKTARGERRAAGATR